MHIKYTLFPLNTFLFPHFQTYSFSSISLTIFIVSSEFCVSSFSSFLFWLGVSGSITLTSRQKWNRCPLWLREYKAYINQLDEKIITIKKNEILLPKVDGDEGCKDEQSEGFLCWEDDDKDALEKVEGVIEAVLNSIDDTTDIFCNFFLKQLVYSEIYHPQPKSE